MKYRSSYYLFAILPLLLSSFIAQAQTSVAGLPDRTTPIVSDLRQRTFEQVWRTIKDKHFDPNFGGVNWDNVRTKYAPQVAAANSEEVFYGLLEKMIGELGQSHFHVFPPQDVIEQNDDGPRDAVTGLSLQVINQQAVITAIQPGSPAALAGLRPGFVITAIDEKPLLPLIKKGLAIKQIDGVKRLMLERQLESKLDGADKTAVLLTYLDGTNRSQKINVARQRQTREMSPAFGNFGPQPLEFVAKRLPGGIGYISFNIWVTPMMPKLRNALKEMQDAPGIIFDVRGNPGGVGGMASGISGHLFKQESLLGKMQMRSGFSNFVAFPQSFVYSGALVVLTDHGSASTSEIFAAGLQDLKRAAVIGERTAGAALPSFIEKLPTGALFQYAVGDFKTSKGKIVEGVGVAPDIVALHTRASLLAGKDVQLQAAERYLTTQLQKRGGAATK